MAATLWSTPSSSSSSITAGSSVFVFTAINHSPFRGLRRCCSTRIVDLVLPKHKSFGCLNDSTNIKCNNNWHMTTLPRQESRQWRQQHLRSSRSCKQPRISDAAINEEENVSRATLIWRAVKLPIYSVALVPLTVGSAAAYFQAGIFSAARYFLLLASSTLVILWLNLSNDIYDFDTGADKNKKESIINIAGTRTGILIAAYLSLSLGFFGLSWASLQSANTRAILLLASAITCGYIYQCPPFRLSYQGLGEPLCFAAFGPFATTAFYLIQSKKSELLPISGNILSASVLVGLTTSLILFCSHFHQVNGDKSVGKYSPLVRLGTEAGAEVVKVSVITLYVILILFGFTKYLPFACVILCGLTIPMGRKVISYVKKYHEDKAKIFMAKYYCVRLHTLFGIALAAGLVVARLFATKAPYSNSVGV